MRDAGLGAGSGVHGDGVARTHAQIGEIACEPPRAAIELAVARRRDAAVGILEDHRRPIGARTRGDAANGVGGDVRKLRQRDLVARRAGYRTQVQARYECRFKVHHEFPAKQIATPRVSRSTHRLYDSVCAWFISVFSLCYSSILRGSHRESSG
jgi:hypothetical protein